MNSPQWTKIYCGVTHLEAGDYRATVTDYDSSADAYILRIHPLNLNSVMERSFKTVEKAKSWAEIQMRKLARP